MSYRVAVDTGGTFTDVVVADEEGRLLLGKALTTPERMVSGLRDALAVIAGELGTSVRGLLGETSLFVYGTTRATNAILERTTARTAFLTTEGFPDVLVLREGGKLAPFNFHIPSPEPYVPRALTYEIPGRIDAQGAEVRPLDRERTRAVLRALRAEGVEAVAVCLLWSIANPAHELAVAALLDEELPGVPYTLSHELNPIIREYRRASSTAIDASLKPLMQEHLRSIAEDLADGGFDGELVVVTSFGGCMHVPDVAARPIYTVNSGPSTAPLAARTYAEVDAGARDVIVCDAGGTSFDVSLILGGEIRTTRETWLGPVWQGHITGLSSVDVKSIGAGGGSIAWIDAGGLLRVGPASAGAVPGPACYARGGTRPTVTDAATVLGYFDPDYFLGGRMRLDVAAAAAALREHVADPLGLSLEEAARAVLVVANEAMVTAIGAITIEQGVDPRECLLVAGGGAGGLSAVAIARELGCPRVLVPRTAGALSACGAQFADVVAEFTVSHYATSAAFDFAGVDGALAGLGSRMDAFEAGLRSHAVTELSRAFSVEARYPSQVWELEIPVDDGRVADEAAVRRIVERFHEAHERVFAVREDGQEIECQSWNGRLTAHLAKPRLAARDGNGAGAPVRVRPVYFDGTAAVETRCHLGASLPPGAEVAGPAILEEATCTIVVPPGATARVTPIGSYLIETGSAEA